MTTIPEPTGAVTVLLVDDQAIVAEAVRRMLATESDIVLHHCADPSKAIETAQALNPTVILQDLVMPDIDGLTLVKFYRAHPALKEVPLVVLSTKEEPIVKAEAFSLGANDYLVKLPDKLELIARIRYHSRAFTNLLERNEAYRRLREEVNQAARYVLSLLPKPLTGRVTAQWKFEPSAELGGDSFGYHWIDDDHLAFYLLDVCGHGVGAALLSVSALNVLRSQLLGGVDSRQPGQVLGALNDMFPMEKHDDKYFTIWYGVYRPSDRLLRYSGAGHPSPLLFDGGSPVQLPSEGPWIGMIDGMSYDTSERSLSPGARLYLFSDGVYEINKADGSMWHYNDFVEYMAALPSSEMDPMNRLLAHARTLQGSDILGDDFSIVLLTFDH